MLGSRKGSMPSPMRLTGQQRAVLAAQHTRPPGQTPLAGAPTSTNRAALATPIVLFADTAKKTKRLPTDDPDTRHGRTRTKRLLQLTPSGPMHQIHYIVRQTCLVLALPAIYFVTGQKTGTSKTEWTNCPSFVLILHSQSSPCSLNSLSISNTIRG